MGMNRWYAKGLAWGAVVAFGLVLGACGTPGSAQSPSAAGTLATTPSPTASTAPATQSARLVTLTLDAPPYAHGASIDVTIHNELAQPIFARDTHANCTIVQLERLQGSAWQSDPSCIGMQPAPRLVRIDADTTLTQTIPGVNDYTGNAWPAGTYRAAVAFTVGPDQSFQQSTVVYSPNFVIG